MKWYTQAVKKAFSGELIFANVKAMLLKDTYVPDQDNHILLADVQSHEVTATGYTAGGQAVINPTITIDNVTNKTTFDCDDVSWPVSLTAATVVFYDSVSGVLMCYENFGAMTKNPFTLQINASGLGTATVGA